MLLTFIKKSSLHNLICAVSIALCSFPIFIPNELVKMEAPAGTAIYSALCSKEFEFSLVASISLAGPLFLDVLLHLFVSLDVSLITKATVIPNFLMLMSFIIPNILLLTKITRSTNISLYSLWLRVSIMLALWAPLYIMSNNKLKYWKKSNALILHLFSCISIILDYYILFVTNRTTEIVLWILLSISCLICVIILIRLSSHWFTQINHDMKIKMLSLNQYLGTIYISSLFVLYFGSMIFKIATSYYHHWYDLNGSVLCSVVIFQAIYFVSLLLLEQKARQRDFIMMKVRIMTHKLCIKSMHIYIK